MAELGRHPPIAAEVTHYLRQAAVQRGSSASHYADCDLLERVAVQAFKRGEPIRAPLQRNTASTLIVANPAHARIAFLNHVGLRPTPREAKAQSSVARRRFPPRSRTYFVHRVGRSSASYSVREARS